MPVLAIDTASKSCAACLFDQEAGAVLASRSETIGTGHAERLMPLIAEVLEGAGVGYDALTRVGVSVGPGSFTGVRIGVAAARGLGLALSIPVVGVSTLAALAHDALTERPASRVLALIDARRDAVYAGGFGGGNAAVLSPRLVPLGDLPALAAEWPLISGNGGAFLGEGSPEWLLRDRATGSIEAFALLAAEASARSGPPAPLYLRDADAKPQTGFALPRSGT